MKAKTQKARNATTTFVLTMVVVFVLLMMSAHAQKSRLTVLNIDSQGMPLSAEQLGNIVRIEVDKLDSFEVTDRYDVNYLLEKHNLNITNCYGKICLVEQGKLIGSDLMLGGSIERYAETIIITLRLINVQEESVVKTTIREFLNLPLELQTMVRICIRDMFNQKNDPALIAKLTKEFNYESMINNPDKNYVNLSGPRMGYAFYTGNTADILGMPKHKGGYDIFPGMFQIGWQFEKQYLNEGNFQALVEFIPLISGMDQNLAIPSLTIMNGLRNNLLGIELAVGPTLNVIRKADGYYDDQNEWHLRSEWGGALVDLPYPLETRLDKRGEVQFQTGFVIAAGWTYKSGRLNIPLNAFFIPSREGGRFGISMGYNAKKNKPRK